MKNRSAPANVPPAFTAYDAYGIRATACRFTVLAWFFPIDSFFIPLWSWRWMRAVSRPEIVPLFRLGLTGRLVVRASSAAP